jgi:hypothetical protein
MTKFKGPRFESFKNPPSSLGLLPKAKKVLGPGQIYVHHCGKKERIRHLRVLCRAILHSHNIDNVLLLTRIREAFPDDELAVLMIVSRAMETMESGYSFSESVHMLLDHDIKEGEDNVLDSTEKMDSEGSTKDSPSHESS